VLKGPAAVAALWARVDRNEVHPKSAKRVAEAAVVRPAKEVHLESAKAQEAAAVANLAALQASAV
jgi:hypothetical protein